MPPRRRTEEQYLDPASSQYEVVTPADDNTDLKYVSRAIEIALAGTLSVIDEKGDVVNFPSFPAGHRFEIRATRIRLTGTSVAAGNIVVFY
jgi:hypothetical protein